MNLPMRQNKKRNQALDAFASIAKTWSEWRLGEKATKTVAKGTKKATKSAAKARKNAAKAAKNTDASSVKRAMKGTPLKIAGVVALVGGIGAAVAKKLKGGGGAEPLYTPPPAPAPMAPAPDMSQVPGAPQTNVVVGDLAGAGDASPVEDAGTDAAVATSESAIAAAAGSTGTDDVPTEPTVPDTDPDAGDADDPDPAADAGAAGDSGDDAIDDDAIEATAPADDETLESAPAGDGHGDDTPSSPDDDTETPAGAS